MEVCKGGRTRESSGPFVSLPPPSCPSLYHPVRVGTAHPIHSKPPGGNPCGGRPNARSAPCVACGIPGVNWSGSTATALHRGAGRRHELYPHQAWDVRQVHGILEWELQAPVGSPEEGWNRRRSTTWMTGRTSSLWRPGRNARCSRWPVAATAHPQVSHVKGAEADIQLRPPLVSGKRWAVSGQPSAPPTD